MLHSFLVSTKEHKDTSYSPHVKRLDDGTPANVDVFGGHIGGL